MTDEEIVKAGKIGTMDPDVIYWRPPSNESKRTMSRVFQIQEWIRLQNRFVEEEEIIRYAIKHFGVQRPIAREYLNKVVEEFRRAGIPVIDQS